MGQFTRRECVAHLLNQLVVDPAVVEDVVELTSPDHCRDVRDGHNVIEDVDVDATSLLLKSSFSPLSCTMFSNLDNISFFAGTLRTAIFCRRDFTMVCESSTRVAKALMSLRVSGE